MAKVIEDLKYKNEDLFINLVSNGKSSNETTTNIAQRQGHIVVTQPENNTQNQEEENNDDDFEPLPEGFNPEERANFSRPPGKKSAPEPKTG